MTRQSRGFTLIELLITVVLLGIAGALVIPSMSSTGGLRIQAAVRTVVADIAFVQSDAMAFQNRRAVVFGTVPQWDDVTGAWQFVEGNGYTLADVSGPELDLSVDAMADPDNPDRPFARDFGADSRYAGALLTDAAFNETSMLIFDELGGPVADLTGDDPGDGGTVTIEGGGDRYTVRVEPFTGRVTVDKEAIDGEAPAPDPDDPPEVPAGGE